MDLTDTQLELALTAWALHARGAGMVVADDTYPAAHALAEHGWLERRVEPDGELSWWWTAQAEVALDTHALIESVKGRHN